MNSHHPENAEKSVQLQNSWDSRGLVQTIILIAITVFGLHLCYGMALPFLPALAWALALAVLFSPLHHWFKPKFRHPSMAAAATVLIVGLSVAVPAVIVGQQLITEAAKGAQIIKTKVESGEWRRAIEAQPRIAPLADWIERKFDLPGTVNAFTTWLTETAGAIVKGSLVQAIGLCLTFYLFFFFLRDRRVVLHSLRALSPLSETEMDLLFDRISDTIFATVYGTLAVSTVQGLSGGLMFWWLGLPASLLWGVVMGLLSVLPVLGAFVVWIPAAIILTLQGSWEKALILTVWGAVVVGGIDNVLRPILVGNRLKLHTVLAFISVVGGVILFGSSGLILGPVALTVTTVLLEVWRSRGKIVQSE